MFYEIILNRNSKFVSNIWKAIFKYLNIKLLITIVYHAQINEQLKKINQIIEIALCFLITKNFDVNWNQTLFALQFNFNNNINATIEHILNKITLEFKFKKIFTIIAIKKFATIVETKINFAKNRFIFKKKVFNATFFVNVKFKIYYDVRHTSLFIKLKNFVYLILNRDYRLLFQSNKKFSQQKCDLFLIKKKIDRLTYKFELLFI